MSFVFLVHIFNDFCLFVFFIMPQFFSYIQNSLWTVRYSSTVLSKDTLVWLEWFSHHSMCCLKQYFGKMPEKSLHVEVTWCHNLNCNDGIDQIVLTNIWYIFVIIFVHWSPGWTCKNVVAWGTESSFWSLVRSGCRWWKKEGFLQTGFPFSFFFFKLIFVSQWC